MPLAADISNWQGPISVAWVQCCAQNGVRLMLPQAVNPPKGFPVGQTREQLQACQDAGMPTDDYVWYWPRQDPAAGAYALAFTDGFVTGHRWMDCETTPPADMHAEEVRREIRDRIGLWGITGIYTRRDWWVSYTGDWDIVSEFPDILLWDAYWTDGRADFTYWDNPVNHYGGWAAPAIKQYGSGNLCGATGIDMNVINEEVYVPAATYVGDNYYAKFGPEGNNTLKDRYDWPAVAANLEGIIGQVQAQSGSDAACEAKLAAIQQIVQGGPTP